MMPSPITPTFFLVRRAIELAALPILTAVQPAAKTAIVQSRSSQSCLKRPAILSLRTKIDNQLLNRSRPFLVLHLEDNFVARFVEGPLPRGLNVDQPDNVKSEQIG